jgi:catechol 2,3-dioxygenase-like lactoylglutathione lyase family enzyme
LGRSLQGFLDRRGEGLFALMLEAADPDAEAVELAARGLDVLPLMPGAAGRDIHPRSTHGVLVRVYPTNSFTERSDDPIGQPEIAGIARVIIAVHDAEEAARPYTEGFALDSTPPEVDTDRGVVSVVCRPPTGGVIELVSPHDASRPFAGRIQQFLDEGQEGMFALVLQTENPEAAAGALAAAGVSVDRADGVEASVFGTRLMIETTSMAANRS